MRWAGVLVCLVVAGCQGKDAGVSQTEEGRLVLGETEQTETIQRTVALNGRTLVLDGFRGTVALSGTDAETASLTFTKQARGRDAQDAASVLNRITLNESGDEATYQYVMRARQNDLSRVDIQGEVPRNADIHIQLESGDVRLSGIAGPMEVQAESGDVAIAGAGSSVEVELRNGPIDLGVYRLAAGSTVDLRTTNGDIAFTAPASVQARIEARTTAGDIAVEGLNFSQRRLNPDGAGARFQGQLGREGAIVELRTENGSITLKEGTVLQLPMDQPADVAPGMEVDSVRNVPPTLPDTTRLPRDTSAVQPFPADTAATQR